MGDSVANKFRKSSRLVRARGNRYLPATGWIGSHHNGSTPLQTAEQRERLKATKMKTRTAAHVHPFALGTTKLSSGARETRQVRTRTPRAPPRMLGLPLLTAA